MGVCERTVFLEKGTMVKDCDRIGYSVDEAKALKKSLIEKDYLEKESQEKDSIIDLKTQIEKNYQETDKIKTEEITRVRGELDKERDRTKWEFWGGLAIGIILTIGAGWAVGQVAR